MITLIKTLLVNITILFSFTYNANVLFPFKEKQDSIFKHKITYGLVGSFGALLCMLYPIETLGATHFDLRMIAILISTIYAGLLSGSIVLGCVIIFRYLIGGPYVAVGIAVSVLALVMGMIFRKMLLKTQYKFLGSTLIFLIHSTFYITIINVYIPIPYICFSDNGKGMTGDELKKIGLPFYTTKTKGTGLGSMVTNKLIREMGGMIEYESELNKGTVVIIKLPLLP